MLNNRVETHIPFLKEQIKELDTRIYLASDSSMCKVPVWERLINSYKADIMVLLREEKDNG